MLEQLSESEQRVVLELAEGLRICLLPVVCVLEHLLEHGADELDLLD